MERSIIGAVVAGDDVWLLPVLLLVVMLLWPWDHFWGTDKTCSKTVAAMVLAIVRLGG